MRVDISFLPALAAAFLLVFARIGTMLMLLPGLGELMVPARVRLTIALVLAAVMLPLHRAAYQIDLQSIGPLLVMLGEELLIGAVLGMTARLTIAALQVTGSVVAQQLGLGFVTAVDPTQGQQGVIIGNFLTMLGVALLFATNLHHLVIAALDDSYTLFAPGEVPLTGDMAALMTRTLAGAFRVGIQLSAPFLVFGLLFNLGLGLLSRLMPQMQVFFVGMPLSILAGFMILFLLIAAMMGTYLGSVEGVLARSRAARRRGEVARGRRNSDDTEKTEDPTQKRLDDAIKRGDVVKSQEVNAWFVLAAGALVLLSFSGSMGSQLAATFRGILANAYRVPADGGGLMALFREVGVETIAAVALPFLLLTLAAIVGNVIQHRLVWSAEALTPKFSKISPLAGAKRLFSKQALVNFVKGLVKLAVVGSVVTALMWPERKRLEGLISADPVAIMPFARTLSLQLFGAVVAILAIIAAADYLFQYQQWYERQKMSLREMKEEFKETEGDPKIKAKIRQLRQGAHEEAHDGGGAEGDGGHHQPDPLRGRAAIRARHERADLRRQGHGRHRAQDPRGRRGERRAGRREPAARARAARHRRDRRRSPGRALQGGRRGHRLRDAAQWRGAAQPGAELIRTDCPRRDPSCVCARCPQSLLMPNRVGAGFLGNHAKSRC